MFGRASSLVSEAMSMMLPRSRLRMPGTAACATRTARSGWSASSRSSPPAGIRRSDGGAGCGIVHDDVERAVLRLDRCDAASTAFASVTSYDLARSSFLRVDLLDQRPEFFPRNRLRKLHQWIGAFQRLVALLQIKKSRWLTSPSLHSFRGNSSCCRLILGGFLEVP